MASEVEEIRGIGHSVRRVEDDRFIRGAGNYIDDIHLPGMLYMAILRSPYAHAKLNGIDASAAQALEGVIDTVERMHGSVREYLLASGLSLADLSDHVLSKGIEPKARSGRQEALENLVNRAIWSTDR